MAQGELDQSPVVVSDLSAGLYTLQIVNTDFPSCMYNREIELIHCSARNGQSNGSSGGFPFSVDINCDPIDQSEEFDIFNEVVIHSVTIAEGLCTGSISVESTFDAQRFSMTLPRSLLRWLNQLRVANIGTFLKQVVLGKKQ